MQECNPFSSRRGVSRSAVATQAIFVILSCVSLCPGQQPTATAVITDLANLPVSDRFGVPDQFGLAGAGDVFFTSGGNSALFRWSKATGARERLLQTNDPIEVVGLPEAIMSAIPPGGLLDAIGSLLQVNSAGQAAFVPSVALKGSSPGPIVLVNDGSSYHFADARVSSVTQLFLNKSGRVAVSGFSEPFNFGLSRIGVGTPPGSITRVIESGQPAPAPVGGSFLSLSLIGLNDAGQFAVLAGINGGSANLAVFVSDGGPLQLVVKSGDSASGSGTFNLRAGAGNYLLNNAGEVAFAADVTGGTAGIWIGKPSTPPVKVMRLSEPNGTDLGGTFSGTLTLRGFNDSGQVLFSADVSDGTSPHALFLRNLAAPAAQVVFSRGQSGGSAGSFNTTLQASLNDGGQVAFLANLLRGDSPMGWYLGSGTASPVKIAAQGEKTPLGGTFGFAGRNTAASINATGQVVFLADVPDAGAVGLFSWTSADGVQTVVSTNDSLPEGANTVLRAGPPATSDTEVMVRVLMAGGQATYYASELKPGTNGVRKIVAEFDPAPELGTVALPYNISMNGKGDVVFTAGILSSDQYPRGGILRSRPDTGLQRVVLTGDELPGGGRAMFFGAPQLNNQTQVAFQTGIDTGGAGIFVASPEPPYLQQVVRTGDAWPGGDAFTVFGLNGNVSLNDKGQVAFLGTSQPQARPGLFVGSAVRAPLKVVEGTDPAPSGTFTGISTPFKLNADGKVAFSGTYGSGSSARNGVFLGSTAAPPQAIATTGSAAPGAGGSTFVMFNANTIDLNASGQVAFWAGFNTGFGWFLGSAGADLQPRLLANQPLPGGGVVNGLPAASRLAALADSGEMAIWVGDTRGTDFKEHLLIAGVDGQLRRVAGNSGKAEGTEGEFGKLFPLLMATPSGQFLFSAILVNGPAKAGIFTSIP